MQKIYNLLPWKRTVYITVGILILLVIANFYGLYTNKFYFFSPSNYIFPVFSIIHLVYLYVVWFKITENELPDPKMRNLEYVLYAAMLVYVFKIVATFSTLLSYGSFDNHIIPATFIPIGILILTLYILLSLLTLLTFKYRKENVGHYKFENFNDNMNYWQ